MSAAHAKAVAAATEHIIQFSIQYCSIALVWYDYALTFGMEREYMWRRKTFTWMTIPYFFTRYALVGNVLYLLAIAHKLPSNCDAWYKFVGALSVLGRGSVIMIFTLRTVGAYNKNKIIAAWLGFLGVTCVALDTTHVPGLRCTKSVSIPIVSDVLAILVTVFELTVGVLIVARSIYIHRHPETFRRGGILNVLLNQGILYFCGVFAFQLTTLVLAFVTTNIFFQRLINALTLPIQCLLTARFTLELREVDAQMTCHTSGSVLSTIELDSHLAEIGIPYTLSTDEYRNSTVPVRAGPPSSQLLSRPGLDTITENHSSEGGS